MHLVLGYIKKKKTKATSKIKSSTSDMPERVHDSSFCISSDDDNSDNSKPKNPSQNHLRSSQAKQFTNA